MNIIKNVVGGRSPKTNKLSEEQKRDRKRLQNYHYYINVTKNKRRIMRELSQSKCRCRNEE